MLKNIVHALLAAPHLAVMMFVARFSDAAIGHVGAEIASLVRGSRLTPANTAGRSD